MNRRTVLPIGPGIPVFNSYSLRVGRLDHIESPAQQRLGKYTSNIAVVEVVVGHHRTRLVRWRLENAAKYSPRRLRARQAFLALCRTLGVAPQRMKTRVKLTHYGFTRGRRRDFCELLRRRCDIKLVRRSLPLDMTASQVVATVLAAPKTTR